jgi:hypothetical protein
MRSVTPSRCEAEPTTGFAPASPGLQDRSLSQSSHVGKSTSARSLTSWGGFGDRLLSQEHTRVTSASAQPKCPAWVETVPT